MPNYSLVMNSKFQPFSFERYIQPLQIYGQAYREQEDALAELDTKASIWDGMANEQTDPIAHAQYKKYADDLRAQADILATEGLNPSSRQAMLNLRGRYAKEIVPIEQAYQRRAEQIAEQRKAGNQMIHSYDASTTSLDEFLGNPSLSYKSINRADLLKESTGLMSQFATELRDFRIDGNLDKFHKKLIQNYGLTKEEANTFATAIASGRIDNNNAVQALAQRIYNSTGVADWNNADASNRVWQTIAEGVTAGIGKQGATVIADEQAKINAQYAKELALMREKARLAAEAARGNQLSQIEGNINPLPLRNQREISDANKELEDYIQKGYITRDDKGWLRLTKKGTAELYRSRQNDASGKTSAGNVYINTGSRTVNTTYGASIFVNNAMGTSPTKTYRMEPTKFGKFIEGLYGEPLADINTRTGEITYRPYKNNKYLNDYAASIRPDSYDTEHTTEYDRQLTKSYGTSFLTQMNSALPGNEFTEVEWDGKNWKPVGTLSFSDLGEGAWVTNIRYKDKGNTAIIQDKEGNKHRVLIPAGINVTREGNISAGFSNLSIYDEILRKGMRPKTASVNGITTLDLSNGLQFTNEPLSDADRAAISQQRRDALNSIHYYGAGIVYPSETDNETYYDD